jgi:WD40 repeat protein
MVSFGNSAAVVKTIAFSPDGKLLVAGHARKVELVETSGPRHLKTLSFELGDVRNVAFSPDGRYFAGVANRYSYANREIRLWDTRSRDLKWKIDLFGIPSLSAVAFTPSGTHLVVGRDNITFYDIETHEPVRVFESPLEGKSILDFAVSRDGRRIIAAVDDQIVEYDERGEIRKQFKAHNGMLGRIGLSPDDSVLATTGMDYQLRCWDTRTWQPLPAPKIEEGAQAYDPHFLPDSRGLLYAQGRRPICLFDMNTQRKTHEFPGDREEIHALAVSEAAGQWASGGYGLVRLWRLP